MIARTRTCISVLVMVSELAFLGNSSYNASKVLPSGYDGVKCLSSKGKYAYSSWIARWLWLYAVGCDLSSDKPALGSTELIKLAF